MRIQIVGGRGGTHVGESFLSAARQLGLEAEIADTKEASLAPRWLAAIEWKLARRPVRLGEFSRSVVAACRERKPDLLLATGLAPLDRRALEAIGALGIRRLNFLTDDPWNPAFKSRWFFQALPAYDRIFSVRRSNMEDLRSAGCRSVTYLPFGYDPALFFPQPPDGPERESFSSDVLFAGDADSDRLPYIEPLTQGRYKLSLYGNYWDRSPKTRPAAKGVADPKTLRVALSQAKVALGLVRRANRDGHAMRSFEIPAVGACMLAEQTDEHMELFGDEGQAVLYFRGPAEMERKLQWLLEHETERRRLAEAAHRVVTKGKHTYQDRLSAILG